MERYFLGIDGGGTKTKVSIIDEKQTNLYMGIGGPSSIDTVNAKQTLQSIRDALADVTEKLGFFPMFSAVYVGLGGIVTETDCHITEKLLRDLPGVTKETKITARNDMENALASGLCFKEGITLIAGTGMVAYGKDKQGNFQKCGGWGYKEGDAGSAYFLGYEALKAAVYATDGRLPATKFTDEVCEVTDMKNMYYIVSVVEK
ncbi:MAG: hypothetical protein IH571_06575 [Acholeplasmataceae bacterium]|nr:hypothetical protein [Acholeplasmataceae bacterium]